MNKNDILINGVDLGITGYGNPLKKYEGKTYEVIYLTHGLGGLKETYIVELESEDWHFIKCIEVPQKLASKHSFKNHRHFEITDLEDYLTEEAYKILNQFDKTRHKYFETYLRRCLGRKVTSFFRDSIVEKMTDLETTLQPASSEEGEASTLDVFSPIEDTWEDFHTELEIEELINSLDAEEQLIVRKLIDGYKSSEISRELNTYRLKVRRDIERIKKKLDLEERFKRNQWRESQVKRKATKKSPCTKRYDQMIKKSDIENKILYLVARAWGIEAYLDAEMSKLDSNPDTVDINKRVKLDSICQTLEMVKKELSELEKELNKF